MLSSEAFRLCELAFWCSIALAALTPISRPFREAHLLSTLASVGAVSVLCGMPVSAAAINKISAVLSTTFAKPAAIWRGPSRGRDQSAPQRQTCLPVSQSRYQIMILSLRRQSEGDATDLDAASSVTAFELSRCIRHCGLYRRKCTSMAIEYLK